MAEPPLLNVIEAETDKGRVPLVCFLDPVLASIRGVPDGSVVGEYTRDESGEFQPEAFRVNPGFVAELVGYMNEVAAPSEEIADQARHFAGGLLYIVDPRDETPPDAEPPAANILGAFEVDASGRVVADSFRYNAGHAMFARGGGVSGVLLDRRFYAWLHDLA